MPKSQIHRYRDVRTDGARVQGKFVQLRWHGVEHLVFADLALCRFHNQIVARFAEAHAIPCHWVSREELECYEDGFTVLGGGRFRADTESRELVLYDNSHAYGRFHGAGLEQRLASAAGPWQGYSVRIANDY